MFTLYIYSIIGHPDIETVTQNNTANDLIEALAERLEESPLKVVKKDGTRTAFDRNKIRQGLDRACEKRPISESQIEAIIEQVEEDIYNLFDREVPTDYIGEQVIARLQQLDQVAYVRFASVYREFKDAHEFVAAVGSLNRGSKR